MAHIAKYSPLPFQIDSFHHLSKKAINLNIQNSELGKAESEVDFWRDFIGWWKDRHGSVTDPRILEALNNAETRYAKVSSLLDDRIRRRRLASSKTLGQP
jgi:hypothetical protein